MNKVKLIAIYLPQFHPIPENNKAWGEGFTEWSNVKKAKPFFEGHYQPHVPHSSIGYYDLLDPEVLVKQAAMAREHGIFGFAYYHYWFNGKRLLNQPLDTMISSGNPDFPFCFIWANENWTKRWDGLDEEVIVKQEYSFEDDRTHIRFLCKNVFSDKRYITVDGKPLFLVYRTELFPDIIKTASIWREEVKLFGFKDIYLVRVESFASDIEPSTIGFDSAMEFAPDSREIGYGIRQTESEFDINKYDYFRTVINMLEKKKTYKYYHCIFPSWDNTARRKQNAGVFINTSPYLFKYFLERSIHFTFQNFNNEEHILFINAWNEWGEGCHIEPDERFGFLYLQFCKEAINRNLSKDDHENMYYELLENRIQELDKNNHLLELSELDLSTKLNHILTTNDYIIGNNIMKQWRRIKRFFKK